MASTGWLNIQPYVRPAVWVIRCQILIGSDIGTVTGWIDEPPAKTRVSPNSGMNLLNGSSSAIRPSS